MCTRVGVLKGGTPIRLTHPFGLLWFGHTFGLCFDHRSRNLFGFRAARLCAIFPRDWYRSIQLFKGFPTRPLSPQTELYRARHGHASAANHHGCEFRIELAAAHALPTAIRTAHLRARKHYKTRALSHSCNTIYATARPLHSLLLWPVPSNSPRP